MLNTRSKLNIAALLLGVSLAARSGADSTKLILENAWSPSAPPGMMMHAGYVVIKNVSDSTVEISGFSSPVYKSVSLHDTITDNGVHKMIEIERPRVEPNSSMVLSPGGKHLMLMGPREAQKPGTEIPVVLELDDGNRVAFSLVVKER